jgi:outer membrane receptor protein involved in Fe transport
VELKKLIAALAAVGLAGGAFAAEGDDKKDDKLYRVEVTGSSLKRINAETASPVQVIDARQIENMGAQTLMQVLDNLPAARPAQQDFRSMFTGSDGGSQANLRGLGAQGTLVLLNGRRLSFYGAPAGFQTMFVNIDAIPAAAIERMEILTDGASAVYGSDAVAGVINVITKKNYQGLEAKASTSHSQEVSSYGEHQASLVYGKGDIGNDGYNVMASLNVYQRDRIALADTYDKRPDYFYVNNPNFIPNFRIGVGSEPGQLNPGTFFVFDPAKNNARTQRAVNGCTTAITEASGTRCVWNNLPFALDTGPKSDRVTGFLSGRKKFGDGLEAFAEAAFTHIRMRGENGPRSFNSGTTNNWFARNTGTRLNTFSYPYLGPNNAYLKGKLDADMAAKMGGAAGLNYLLQDATGHFGQKNEDDNYRVLAGLRGHLGGSWDFETALGVAGSHSTLYQTINVNTKGFEKAFGPTYKDPVTGRTYISDNPAYKFGEISAANAALIREAYPTFDIQSWTKLITFDAKVEGTLFNLGDREVRAAFGTNLMRESFETPGNPDAANGLITQQGGSWFDGERTVSALFGEVVVPVTDNLEVNAAARLDKYPHFSANLAPKVGVQWRARPEIMVRGTYSEGFRAPNLAESGSGGVFAQVGGIRDTVRCDETNADEVRHQDRTGPGQDPAEFQLLHHGRRPDPAQPEPAAGKGQDLHPGPGTAAGQGCQHLARLLVRVPPQRDRAARLQPAVHRAGGQVRPGPGRHQPGDPQRPDRCRPRQHGGGGDHVRQPGQCGGLQRRAAEVLGRQSGRLDQLLLEPRPHTARRLRHRRACALVAGRLRQAGNRRRVHHPQA